MTWLSPTAAVWQCVWPFIGVAREGLGPKPQREWKKFYNRFSRTEETNIYVKVLCLVTVNVTKYMAQKCQI